jgi:release factor glutamine methyltransferase
MTIEAWLIESERLLRNADIATARLDCLVLLEDVLSKSRALLLGNLDTQLDPRQLKHLDAAIKRRSSHEPLAYIRGKSDFFGREFFVTKDTLQPRPESETMLELLASEVNPDGAQALVDVGTGSGALAISALLEHPSLTVWATEISAAAIGVASRNAKKHHSKISFFQTDLIADLPRCPDIILANLPYVPDTHTINKAAMQEPKVAIFGGPDGLNVYRRLFEQLIERNWKPQFILTEALPPQHKALKAIAASHQYKLDDTADFIQVFTA